MSSHRTEVRGGRRAGFRRVALRGGAIARIGVVAGVVLLAGRSSGQVVHDPLYTLSLELSGLNNPQGIDTDAAGRVYVTDSGNGRILRGHGGVYEPIISGIAVSPFVGLDIGPLSVLIAPDNTLFYGEGGRATGVEQIHHHTLGGSPLGSLAPVPFGGNWSGLAVNPATGSLLATSANGDRIFHAPAIAGSSGPTFGALSELVNTLGHFSVSPVGIVATHDIIYAAMFGSFGGEGSIASYDAATGALINPAVATGLDAATGLDILPDGRLIVAEYGSSFALAAITIVDPLTGVRTPLVTGITAGTGVAVHSDGTIYFVDSGNPNASDGRLFRLTPIPAPGTGALIVMGGLIAARRRSRRDAIARARLG